MNLNSWTTRILIFIGFISLCLIFIFLFLAYSGNNGLDKDSILTPLSPKKEVNTNVGETKIELVSELTDYNVTVSKDQLDSLNVYLKRLELNDFQDVTFRGLATGSSVYSTTITPSTIRIVLRNIGTINPTKDQKIIENFAYALSLNGRDYANIYVGNYNPTTNSVEIPLYVDMGVEFSPNTSKDNLLSHIILYTVAFNFQERKATEIENFESKIESKVKLDKPFVTLRKKLIQNFSLIKEVNAQYICGQNSCYKEVRERRCRYQGNICSLDSECSSIPNDSCISVTRCTTESIGVSCQSTTASCILPNWVCQGSCGSVYSSCQNVPTAPPDSTPPPPPPGGGGGSSNANCGVGCIGNWNCGTIPGARAPICSANGGGFCTDCTCDGNCDPPLNCTQMTWCTAGISCGAGERCQWNGGGGGYVRSPWDGSVSWSGNGGWNCIPEPACTTCSITLQPDPVTISVGTTVSMVANVNSQQNGVVNQVNFSSSNSSIASVNPGSDSSSPFFVDTSGVSVGTVTVTANAYMGGVLKCSDTATVTVNTSPWWQVVGGDVISNGAVNSNIPSTCTTPGCNPVLIRDGVGGFPGIVSYVTGYDFQAGSGAGNASSKNWLVNTTSQQNQYTYSSFESLVPSNVVMNNLTSGSINGTALTSGGSVSSDGYYWYKVTGDLTISNAATVSGRKVILFVDEGNLTINGNISTTTPGSDFFMALVGNNSSGTKGNITIGISVTQVDGLYLADSTVSTGAGNTAFRLRGSVAAGGFSLQRDLGNSNSNTPAEVFEFSPAMMFAFPQSLLKSDINWQEIAP